MEVWNSNWELVKSLINEGLFSLQQQQVHLSEFGLKLHLNYGVVC